VDRLLQRQLNAIAHNRTSGAAELALRAITALRAWLRRHARPHEPELLEIARALLHAQPAMAPFGRLANELLLAIHTPVPLDTLNRALAGFGTLLQTATDRIAARFVKSLRPGFRYSVGTHSYSSTVLKAISAARQQIPWVVCSESRPDQEGRLMAEQIGRLGVEVRFVTDAALPAWLPFCSLLVVGADAIASHDFQNKVGTRAMVTRALEEKKPVWVLADTLKFWHAGASFVERWARFGPHPRIWPRPPKGVAIVDVTFEWTPIRGGIRILTERGWLTSAGVQREVERIPIAPQLKQWILAKVDKGGGAA
jgi:translation initiation factor 2B subunit (eIF-2B alpha/beta/delta family)